MKGRARGTNLPGARLHRARLCHARLRHARLRHARPYPIGAEEGRGWRRPALPPGDLASRLDREPENPRQRLEEGDVPRREVPG
ncbi:pentapeptide repeat-containing protein [Pararoseomonas sp. SCSIO 73927]|uniref:pentapeptide repeat-containing protein n=1 Tax=Pararoseomonas sp. SCSIO 73927 TaxID=3114537 RepID=UPI0038D090EF